jgi:hypothetical protein
MGDPTGSKEAWNRVVEAYDELAGGAHRARSSRRCACGAEFRGKEELTEHIHDMERRKQSS